MMEFPKAPADVGRSLWFAPDSLPAPVAEPRLKRRQHMRPKSSLKGFDIPSAGLPPVASRFYFLA